MNNCSLISYLCIHCMAYPYFQLNDFIQWAPSIWLWHDNQNRWD